jgi:succinate dehydrogenase / fumarate reductase flavoprotein subunit
LKTGKLEQIQAKAVILATGGAGRIYKFTTNSAIKTGDGMALALEAGASLKDMEFIQFHPTALAKTGILITEAARGEGGYLLNNKGERFLKKYLPEKMELSPRDLITRAILEEIKAGHAFTGPYGPYIHLDIRHLGKKTIDEKLPFVREVATEYGDVDPVHMAIPIKPAQHYFMGGIHTNIKGETTLPGLYAAGETACVTIHGANRLGSNSLAECLVFGAATGKAVAQYVSSTDHPAKTANALKYEENLLNQILKKQGSESINNLKEEMATAMDRHAGITRDENSLNEGYKKIMELKERFQKISLNDQTRIFNSELTGYFELQNMLNLSETIIKSALARTESRGAHYRTDHPHRDDQNFQKHHLIAKNENGLDVTEIPVKITKWQPAERKY